MFPFHVRAVGALAVPFLLKTFLRFLPKMAIFEGYLAHLAVINDFWVTWTPPKKNLGSKALRPPLGVLWVIRATLGNMLSQVWKKAWRKINKGNEHFGQNRSKNGKKPKNFFRAGVYKSNPSEAIRAPKTFKTPYLAPLGLFSKNFFFGFTGPKTPKND